MGAEPAATESFAASLGDGADRDTRGVRANDSVGAAMAVHPFEQGLLDLEALHDRFHDPVALGESFQILVEAAKSDAALEIAGEEGVRTELRGAVEAARGGSAVEVEQEYLDAGVGKMGRNLCAHGAGAQHSHGANRGGGYVGSAGHRFLSPCTKRSTTSSACATSRYRRRLRIQLVAISSSAP